jgi:hypothetical protein
MNDVIQQDQGGAAVFTPETSVIQALTRAEIDQQIATAHQFPRSISLVQNNITSLVTISQEFAAECNYSLPRGGKTISGPSIRLAEVVYSQWGNCRVASRVTVIDRRDKFIEAEAVFHDLQTNAAVLKRSRRKISDRNGNLYNDDMIIMTGNACQAIAMRNAIFAGVPKAVWNQAYDLALQTVRGDVKTLGDRRKAGMEALQAFGLSAQQVYAALGVEGAKDIDMNVMVDMAGILNALKTGEATVEQVIAMDNTPTRTSGSIATKPKQQKAKEEDPVIEDENPNPAAEEAMKKEAERVAAKRQEEERAAQIAENELQLLRGTYQEQTGKTPDGRWNADTLKEKLNDLLNPPQDDEPPQEETSPTPTGPTVDESPHDPETGEVLNEAPETGGGDHDFHAIYDEIMNDLMDATDPDEIIDLHGISIENMKNHAPDLHANLMKEIAAAKE